MSVNEAPTNYEIDAAYSYYLMNDESKAYKEYIEPLVKKHGQAWVDVLLGVVLENIILSKAKKK